MSNKQQRRRTRQTLGQETKRGNTSFRSKSWTGAGSQACNTKACIGKLDASSGLRFRPYYTDPEILACFSDYPERYRKIKGFTNSLWAHGPKSVDVRRPFLRGLSAVNGRWAVARPSGELVLRFHDHVNAQSWAVAANRRLRRWFRLEWYYLVDLSPPV